MRVHCTLFMIAQEVFPAHFLAQFLRRDANMCVMTQTNDRLGSALSSWLLKIALNRIYFLVMWRSLLPFVQPNELTAV